MSRGASVYKPRKQSVYKPRKEMDKSLVFKAIEETFNASPEAVRLAVTIMRDETATKRERLKAAELILERTVPTVARHQVVDERPSDATGSVDWEAIYREALDAVSPEPTGNGDGSGDSRIH